MGIIRSLATIASSIIQANLLPDRNLLHCAHPVLAHIKGFPYYGSMNITLSLDDNLVKEVRKIAVERDTTLTGLVRAHLQELAAEHAKSGRKRRELQALRESFEKYQFNLGKRTWKREDLHERR